MTRGALFGKLYPYLPGLQTQPVAMRQAFFHYRREDLANPLFSHLPRCTMTARLKQFFSPEFMPTDQQRTDFEDVSTMLPENYSRWHPFCQAQYLETVLLMPGYILSSQSDRAAMAHSVEGRFPFLDHRVAELAARMPPRLKMCGLDEKHVLKRAARDLVPPAVARRNKQPYRAPDAQSFFNGNGQSAQLDYMEDLLSLERLDADHLFNAKAVEKLLRKLRSGRSGSTRDNMALVGILSTQLLIEQFVRHRPGVGDSACCLATPAMIPLTQHPMPN